MNDIKQLSPEETKELYSRQLPNVEQLKVMAEHCGLTANITEQRRLVPNSNSGSVPIKLCVTDDFKIWDPVENASQNYKLLQAVIVQGDCRLFYDHEVHEWFIYQYPPIVESTNFQDEFSGPLAHHPELEMAVIEAAMNLWFPEEK